MTSRVQFPSQSASTQHQPASVKKGQWVKPALIGTVLVYLSLILFVPTVSIFMTAFGDGIGPFLNNLTEPQFVHAAVLTVLAALIAVPLNLVFGLCAAWAIARKKFLGRTLLLSILDLPFSISPVVAGLMIVLLYGRNGWFGSLLQAMNFKVVFAFPGIALATIFITLPFVAREVIPALEEAGFDQEEAAKTLGASEWQTFWYVTLPTVRWSLLYGVILTNARAMGEFGAVAVVSGNLTGQTQTLALFVEDAYKQYQTNAAFAAAVVLTFLAVITLVLKEILERKTRIKDVELET
jgi:sulfate transport system permease protein